jgi:hypothetical protein
MERGKGRLYIKGWEQRSLLKSYRPVYLTSFFLKTMETLIELRKRSKYLKRRTLHFMQSVYQAGKSTVEALHHQASDRRTQKQSNRSSGYLSTA